MFGRHVVLDLLALAIVLVPLRGPKRILTWIAYPAFVYFLPLACSLWAAEGLPRINFFERGQSLLQASNMMHGARAYRDTVPLHGFLEDGGFDFLAMRFGGARVDFGVYALLATALLMSPRRKVFGGAGIGILAAAIPVILLFAVLGILPSVSDASGQSSWSSRRGSPPTSRSSPRSAASSRSKTRQ
ncbi:MAG TPA: hypothetical protein VH087_03440 [Thermoanaerobaculia bacterium]|nr:hypothetical protein [Thermoanaerobaculia bacterium]